MVADSKIIKIFCLLDDSSKEYNTLIAQNSLPDPNGKKRRNRKSKMSDGEVMTILVIFYLKSYRNLKHFYINHICKFMGKEFQECVPYNRFVELQKKIAQPLGGFLKMHCLG